MNTREKIYYLLENYLQEKYSTKDFCELFSDVLNFENDNSLGEEEILLKDLEEVTSRFSPYEEDYKLKNAYFTEKDVKESVKNIIGR